MSLVLKRLHHIQLYISIMFITPELSIKFIELLFSIVSVSNENFERF